MGQWCGGCYENVRGRTNRKGHRGYRRPPDIPVESLEMVLKKRDAASPAVGAAGKLKASKWSLSYPSIWEMLTAEEWEDGTPRKRSTVTIFIDEGQAKVSLNDRANGLVGFCTASSVEEALAALESALKEDRVEWRRSFDNSKGKGRK
jgi:hypothetical protein